MTAFRSIYVSGGTTMMLTFSNRDVGMEWHHGVNNIKEMIAGINSQKNRKDDYVKWLAEVRIFRQRWGDTMVPPDIRTAVHSVEDGIGLARTDWQA
jgi:hypothetical protein